MAGVKKALRVDWGLANRVIAAYEEKDEFGRRKWSQQEIADSFGLGGSTVGRIINRQGPYRTVPEVKTVEEQKNDFALVEQEVIRRLTAPPPEPTEHDKNMAWAFGERLKAPDLSKLDDPELQAKLEAEAKERARLAEESDAAYKAGINARLLGNRLPIGALEPEEFLKELTGEQNDGYK